jgi:hypothetical protein
MIVDTAIPPPGLPLPAPVVDTSEYGTQLYKCLIHPWMRAKITVE